MDSVHIGLTKGWRQANHGNGSGGSELKNKDYHHGDLREALLRQGLRLLDAEGESAIGVRRLARELGVAHSAPGNHFKRRDDLLTALATHCFEDLAHRIDRDAPPSALQRLEALGRALIAYGLEYPHRYRLMFRPGVTVQPVPPLKAVMDRIYDQLLSDLTGVLGETSVYALETHAVSYWSMLHGYVLMRLDGNFEAATDKRTGLPREEALIQSWLARLPRG